MYGWSLGLCKTKIVTARKKPRRPTDALVLPDFLDYSDFLDYHDYPNYPDLSKSVQPALV